MVTDAVLRLGVPDLQPVKEEGNFADHRVVSDHLRNAYTTTKTSARMEEWESSSRPKKMKGIDKQKEKRKQDRKT